MSAERELMRLEARVLASADVAGWLASVDTLRELLHSKPDDVRAAVLRMVVPKIERRALRAVLAAFALGRDDALAIVGSLDDAAGGALAKRLPSKGATAPVRGLDAAGRQALAVAVRIARDRSADPQSMASPLLGHANRVRGSISDAVNRGGNEGSTAVADVAELGTVWIAETDACVNCLAYSGVIAKPGKSFPGGLTYGRKSYYPEAIATPPRHRNCRCVVEPLVAPGFASALRREADRSVLRGFSLESESMAVRVDAAERLLERGVNAPKSVIAFSRRAVRAGGFPTRGRPQ